MATKKSAKTTSKRAPSTTKKRIKKPVKVTARKATKPAAKRKAKAIVIRAASSPTRKQIAERAYEIWISNGCPPYSQQANWYQAEKELARTHLAAGQ